MYFHLMIYCIGQKPSDIFMYIPPITGPGLGRNQSMLGRISIVIDKCKARNIPIVIDADGLWHLTNNPNVIKGYKKV